MSFKDLLEQKKVLTVEFNPPKSIDIAEDEELLKSYKGLADAINITDSPMAKARANSILSSICIKEIVCPIFNLTCRDRNKIAIQADLIGAAACGLKNLLAITGDPSPQKGDNVYHLNVFELIRLIGNLNDSLNTDFFIGVASNVPTKSTIKAIRQRLQKKVDIGARFVITQPIYSKESLENFLEASNGINIAKIIGIMPILSYKSALYLNNYVKGINIPKSIIHRFESALKLDTEEIAKEIVAHILDETKVYLNYINGFHVMKLNYDIVLMVKKILEGK